MIRSNAFNLQVETVRVLSFQTKNVVDILLSEGSYLADIKLSREKRDYHLDVEQLGGRSPVWGFMSTNPRGFHPIDFLDSYLFELFRCEMSLGKNGLQTLSLLELEVPKDLVKIGLTHNTCDSAVVLPGIELSWLISISRVEVVKNNIFDYRYTVIEYEHRTGSVLLDNIAKQILKIHDIVGIAHEIVMKPDYQSADVFTTDDTLLYSVNVDDRKLKVEVGNLITEPQLSNLKKELGNFFRTIGVSDISFLDLNNN